MNRDILKQKVVELFQKTTLSKDDKCKILTMIGSLPKKGNRPITYKVGDVFMCGGIQHPIVLLKKEKNGDWICCSLTSSETCDNILEECSSRFFSESYITKTLIIIGDLSKYSFMGVYDNNRHLKTVLNKLKDLFI